MDNVHHRVTLRPGVTNRRLWYPESRSGSEWKRIRKLVLKRDDYTCAACGHRALKWMNVHHLEDSGDNRLENLALLCVACHSVLHVGLALMHGSVEIWQCEISQLEIVQRTREGIRQGLSLDVIKSQLPLTPGKLPPDSVDYANKLILKMGTAPRAYLDEPLCAVFVKLERWQIET